MGKVSAGVTMSLDGFIAGLDDTGFDLLFKRYGAGDVDVPMPDSTAGVPMARQALEAGLLDEIGVDLVPVILGAGTPSSRISDRRPWSSRARSWSSKGSASRTCATAW